MKKTLATLATIGALAFTGCPGKVKDGSSDELSEQRLTITRTDLKTGKRFIETFYDTDRDGKIDAYVTESKSLKNTLKNNSLDNKVYVTDKMFKETLADNILFDASKVECMGAGTEAAINGKYSSLTNTLGKYLYDFKPVQ